MTASNITRPDAAKLAIHDAGGMTVSGRRKIAKWLRHQADMLETEGKNYAKRFTARYIPLLTRKDK